MSKYDRELRRSEPFTPKDLQKYGPRFLHFIRVMNEVVANEKAFDMRVIVEKYEPEDFEEENRELGSGKLEKSCGTSACMMGWAGLDPWHRRRGLISYIDDKFEFGKVKFGKITNGHMAIEAYLSISYEEAKNTFFAEGTLSDSEALESLKALAIRKGVDISIIPTEAK